MSVSLSPDVAAAYAHCESVTRTRAANFYYGIRLLSAERRRAMCAVYAFSREVDDIGDDDGGLTAAEKLRLLDTREAALALLEAGRGTVLAGPPARGGLEGRAATAQAAAVAHETSSPGDGVGAPSDSPAPARMRVSAPGGALAPDECSAGGVPHAVAAAARTSSTAPARSTQGENLSERFAAEDAPMHAGGRTDRLPGAEAREPAGDPRAWSDGAAGHAATEPAADPVIVALADACRRFPIPVGALRELIEGVRMDVREVGYERFEELVPYCRRVAGAIGRVCLAIFALRAEAGADRAAAESLADDLGVALQLTNILRDVREDAENGRVYLPLEDLRRFGLLEPETRGDGNSASERASERLASLAVAAGGGERSRAEEPENLEALAELVRFEASRAREWFARGGRLASLLDRRSAACLLAMAGIYSRLLDRIEAQPVEAVGRRMSLPAHEKAWVALRGMLGVSL